MINYCRLRRPYLIPGNRVVPRLIGISIGFCYYNYFFWVSHTYSHITLLIQLGFSGEQRFLCALKLTVFPRNP